MLLGWLAVVKLACFFRAAWLAVVRLAGCFLAGWMLLSWLDVVRQARGFHADCCY
jgi:hypothetical protein